MPKVSVIISAYQKAKYLPRALQSVLDQTCSALEVIVVDDGSTDSTKEIVDSFAKSDSRVRYIYQDNQGPGGARNTGVREANFDWVALLDGDDAWLPNKLEVQTRVMQEFLDIDLLFTSALYVDTRTGKSTELNSKYLSRYFNLREREQNLHLIADNDFPSKILRKNPFILSTVIFRKAVFADLKGFNVELRGPEDLDFWTRAALKKRQFAYTSHVSTIYYKNETSLVQASERSYQEQLKHAVYAFRSPEYEPIRNATQSLVHKRFRQLVIFYAYHRQPSKAWQTFRQSTSYGVSIRTLLMAVTAFVGPTPLTAYREARQFIARWI